MEIQDSNDARAEARFQWPVRNGQSMSIYAIEVVLACKRAGISIIPENILNCVGDAAKNEVVNTFLGDALGDSMQLCLEAMPDESVVNLEALILHVLTVDDLNLYVIGSFAEYLDGNDFSFFGDAAGDFQMLCNEESTETVQGVCVFLTMVALVRYVGTSDTDAGHLLYTWNEHYVDYTVSDRIGYDVSMSLIKWFVAYYTTMNEHNIEYESRGVFGSECDLDFYQMSIRFVNTNNIRGIEELITLDRFWIDHDNQTGSFLDMFACREVQPEVLYALMDFLGGKFEHNDHIFETAFMDWMSTRGMIAEIINQTESTGHINTESDAYKKLIKCVHVLQMLLAHSPVHDDNAQGQWGVSLPFKFLLWILRSFGLQDTQLQADIVLWIVHNGERPIQLFTNHGTFCGLEYGHDEYGEHIRDFMHLSADKAQPFEDNQRHKTTFCTEAATLRAIHGVTSELFKLFKQHLSSEVHGCVLAMNENCYSELALHYDPRLYELYADKVYFQ